MKRLPAASASAGLKQAGPRAWERTIVPVAASHRPEPISVVVVRPTSGSNQRLVVVSHGLWDSPGSFGGWAEHLASHGYIVIASGVPGK